MFTCATTISAVRFLCDFAEAHFVLLSFPLFFPSLLSSLLSSFTSHPIGRSPSFHFFLSFVLFFVLSSFPPAMKFYCDNLVDGGGWALVRRVKQGAEWHPATDNLAGTQAAYGTYGGPTFDATFGRPYSTWVTTATEFLFTTGMASVCFELCCYMPLTFRIRRSQQVAHHNLGPDQQRRHSIRRQLTAQRFEVQRQPVSSYDMR